MKSSLGKEELRGKIISIDENNSFIRAEILGCGENLYKDWGKFPAFQKSFNVQPGDLNLLKNKSTFAPLPNKLLLHLKAQAII